MSKLLEVTRERTTTALVDRHHQEWLKILQAIEDGANRGETSIEIDNDYGDLAPALIDALRLKGFQSNFNHEGRTRIYIDWRVR